MKRPKYIAVVTGDMVSSSLHLGEERKKLDELLTAGLTDIFAAGGDRQEVYRGDSFQVETDVVTVLRKAIRLRAFLKMGEDFNTDARIAIGIGKTDYTAEKVARSDGEAYQLSGRAFDALKKGDCLQLTTRWTELDELMGAVAALTDSIITGYTTNQAEAMYYSLQENTTQTEIAKRLGKYQSTVSARLKSAHFDAIENAVESFETVIKRKIKK